MTDKEIKIKRDIIPGLDVGYGIISEKLEKQLFESSIFSKYVHMECRTGEPCSLPQFPPEILKLTELIKEELYPDLIQPDYCLGLNYPPKTGQFASHYDSRYRWGEAIVGISLGRPCIMYFTKKGEKAVEVYLEPGSIYIMKGSSRYDYRHGIRKLTEKRMNELEKQDPVREWNELGLRRSITLRSTKMYSDMMLEYLSNSVKSTNNDYLPRIKQQSKFKPKNKEGSVVKKNLKDPLFNAAIKHLTMFIKN